MFSDGALGARSAWLLEEYSDRPGHTSGPRTSSDFMTKEIKKAHDAGFQVSIHAIGDAAVKQVMDAHEAANPENKNYRFMIEHFMVAREEEFERLKGSGIIPSMQYVELSSDMNMIEKRVGKERSMGAYAWRKLLNAGVKIAAGTDLPMDVLNPYENMYYGVSRCTINEEPQGGWHPWEALTRYEVLKSYTLDSAYARFEEDKLGSLEAGKYADFVVIDRDYMNCAVKEIKDIKALMTVIGGEILYRR
jgi:predicted amidohydrolase YtcJ